MSEHPSDLNGFLRGAAGVMRTLVERSIAPQDVNRLYASREFADSCLTHEDPKVRWGAIIVIAHHWGLDDAFGVACGKLLLHDPDADVRAFAMTYLGYCYHNSDDSRIGRLAGEIVYDNSAPHIVRLAAYKSLFQLRRSARSTVAKKRIPSSREFRFPQDVDWPFVDTFLFGGKKKGVSAGDINGLFFP